MLGGHRDLFGATRSDAADRTDQPAQNVFIARHVETMYLDDLAQHTFATSGCCKVAIPYRDSTL